MQKEGYKIQLHCHSNRSHDGKMSVRELIDAYRAAGFSGIAITDHEGDYDHSEMIASPYEDFVVLNGIELGKWGPQTLAIENTLFVAAHPGRQSFRWEGKDILNHSTLNFIEAYNGREDRYYRELIKSVASKSLKEIYVDDTHHKGQIGRGYVKVRAKALSKKAIIESLLSGAYDNIRGAKH